MINNKIMWVMMMIVVCGFCGGSNNAIAPSAHATSLEQMRFHCSEDTTKINSLLEDGAATGISDANGLVCFYAHKLEGTPYVGHTLEGGIEMLTINIDQLDCTTFVETLYALTRATLNGKQSWRDYANYLEDLRYRGGELKDYSSRLHYISEWIIDNKNRGNLDEVTSDISCCRYKVKTIDFMTTHRGSYSSLADNSMYEKIKNVEIGFRNHRFPYIKKDQLGMKDVLRVARRGDFVGLVTKIEGLDISHMGVIEVNDKGELVLLDASSVGGKVMLEKLPLKSQLMKNSKIEGVRLFRMKE